MTLSEVYYHPTDVHGTTLRLPSHRAVQWLVSPDHERGRWRTLRHHVRPDSVVYDIGSEQGDLSALLASWVPDGGVVLVEPNEKAWPCIRATFEENDGQVLATYVGLVASTTSEDWVKGLRTNCWPDSVEGVGDRLGSGHRPPRCPEHRRRRCRARSPAGATHVLTHDRPVIALSVHPEFLAHWWAASAAEVLDLVESYGYRCDLVHADHELAYVCVPR